MKTKELSTQKPFSISRTDTLDLVAKLMWEHDLGALPVVNDHNQVIGMITDRDIAMAAFTQGKRLIDIVAESSMSKSAITCSEDDEVGKALELMQKHQIHRIPVLDNSQKLVGILSFNDVALAYKARPKKDLNAESVADTIAAICKHRPRPNVIRQVA